MPSIQDLLVQTSRTFALAIPLLPEPTRNTTSLAYLLLRIADTLRGRGDLDSRTAPEVSSQFGALLSSPTRAQASDIEPAMVSRRP